MNRVWLLARRLERARRLVRAILNTRSETLVVQKNMQFEARVEERLNELMRNCDMVPLMVLTCKVQRCMLQEIAAS